MSSRALTIFLLLVATGVLAQTQKIDSLHAAITTAPNDTTAILTTIALTEALWTANQNADALLQAQAAFDKSQSIGYIRGHGLASLQMGILAYLSADFRKSIDVLGKAIRLLEAGGTKAEQGLAYHWAGNTCYRIGQFDKAHTYYFNALRLREQLNDQRGVSFTLFNIANIYTAQKDYGKALEYHTKALALKETLGEPRAVATSYNNIANIYFEQNQLDEALTYYTKAMTIFQSVKNKQGVAYAQGNIGRIYKKKKRYGQALTVLRQAINILEEVDDKQALLEANNELADVHVHLKEYDKAEAHLIKAQALANETGIEDKLIDTYLTWSQLDSARGNTSGALAWHKKYMAKKETIFNAQNSAQINALQAAFDLEQKDREIGFLNSQKELQEQLARNQRWVFSVIVIALLAIAGILIFFLYQKQKTNKLLEEQKKYAEGLNQFKDKLFSIISHDLRSPLSSLKGVLQLASAQQLTEKELNYMLRTLGENTGHVTDLIDNLLHWARGHLSGEILQPDVNDLAVSVNNAIDLLKPIAEKKQITITNHLTGPFNALCDNNMISIVLRNLISNAIKFTPPGGAITIRGATQTDTVTLSIDDTGVGLSPEQQLRLFSHQTITTPGTANEKGTGLGLILCSEFVEKNGGTIGVRGNGTQGSVFYFSLPKG